MDAKPTEHESPTGKPANYYFWFPPMGRDGQYVESRKMGQEFWQFVDTPRKRSLEALIKAILAKRARDKIEAMKKELTVGKQQFSSYYPDRNTEIMTMPLAQADDPSKVSKLVDWRVRLMIKGLDHSENLSGWFSKTHAANVYPSADWMSEELKGLATPIMMPGGAMVFLTT